jgi:hypothetical protein
MTRPALLALATGLLLGCADTNAPPPEPLELLLVVNGQSNSLTIVSVDGLDEPTSVPLVGSGATPTTVAAREGIAVVPLGQADEVAVVDLIGRRLIHLIPLPEGSGATGAAMVSDSVAYVGNPGRNTVSRVNVFTRETVEVPVGVFPQGLTVARGRLFVLNGNVDQTGEPAGPSWITVLNPATNAPAAGIDSIPLTGPGNAAFAAVAADGLLYVVNRGRSRFRPLAISQRQSHKRATPACPAWAWRSKTALPAAISFTAGARAINRKRQSPARRRAPTRRSSSCP